MLHIWLIDKKSPEDVKKNEHSPKHKTKKLAEKKVIHSYIDSKLHIKTKESSVKYMEKTTP